MAEGTRVLHSPATPATPAAKKRKGDVVPVGGYCILGESHSSGIETPLSVQPGTYHFTRAEIVSQFVSKSELRAILY
jgi:hypothetical protein